MTENEVDIREEIWVALMLAPPPLPPAPPPECPPLELELEAEVAEAAEELDEEEAALPAALMVTVSSGIEDLEVEEVADTEWTVFVWPESFVINELILLGEEETAEINMAMSSLHGGPSPGCAMLHLER